MQISDVFINGLLSDFFRRHSSANEIAHDEAALFHTPETPPDDLSENLSFGVAIKNDANDFNPPINKFILKNNEQLESYCAQTVRDVSSRVEDQVGELFAHEARHCEKISSSIKDGRVGDIRVIVVVGGQPYTFGTLRTEYNLDPLFVFFGMRAITEKDYKRLVYFKNKDGEREIVAEFDLIDMIKDTSK